MKLMTILLIIFSHNIYAKTSLKDLKEVKLSEIFIAPVGYDDNDNIEITVDGKLPNACFDLFSLDATIDHNKKIIYVKQTIRKKNLTECNSEQNQRHNILFPVHFSNTVSLGELSEGNYEVIFKSQNGKSSKFFNIAKAIENDIDNTLYAPVSSAFIPELIYESNNAQVILTGILENSCMLLNANNIEVQRHQNIFIIIPKLKILTNRPCRNSQQPLQQFVNLGKVSSGRYFVHVRSITGRSINKTFSVIKNKQTDYSGF